MKILKRGVLPTEKPVVFQCHQCDSEIEAFPFEAHASHQAKLTDPGHYAPMTPAHLVFRCPVCSTEVKVFT